MKYPPWLGSLLGTSALCELDEILPRAALQAVCQIESLRREPKSSPDAYVHAIRDVLMETEAWWHCADLPARQTLDSLGAAALRVARQVGQSALLSIAHTIHGKRLVACGDRTGAVASFREALRFARRSEDRRLLVDSLIDAAHYAAGGGVGCGRELLLEARTVLDATPTAGGCKSGILQQHSRFLENMGVLEFDSGNFGAAEDLLRACLLQATRNGVDLGSTLTANYLAQVLTASGRFSAAEELLLKAVGTPARVRPGNTVRGYNLALLGKVRLEAGAPDMASGPIVEGYSELCVTQHASVLPIVRNYYAELLIHPAFRGRDLDLATELLAVTAEECHRTGYVRSRVAAMALQAKIESERGDVRGALALAETAARLLSKAGSLPAVRSEEIYLIYCETLRACGHHARADRVLAQASAILRSKADSLRRTEHRKAFLSAVGVSVSIADALKGA